MTTIADTLRSLLRADPSEIKKISDHDLRVAVETAHAELRHRGWTAYDMSKNIQYVKQVRL